MTRFPTAGHLVSPDVNTERRTRNYVAQLAAMGYRVTLEPAA